MSIEIDPTVFERRTRQAIAGESLKHWCERVGLPLSTLTGAFQRKAVPKADVLALISIETGRSINWLLGLLPDDDAEHARNGSATAVVASEEDHATPAHPPHAQQGATGPLERRGAGAPGTMPGGRRANSAYLSRAVQVLEEWAAESGASIDPERKGAIISVLYNYLERGAEKAELLDLLHVIR